MKPLDRSGQVCLDVTMTTTYTFTSALTGRTFDSLRVAQTVAVQEMQETDNDEALVLAYAEGVQVCSYRYRLGAVAYGWEYGQERVRREAAFGKAIQP